MSKVIALMSGGLDSTVLVAKLIAEGHLVKGIGFDYGQRHRKELFCAGLVAAKLGVDFKVCDLSGVNEFIGGSSQTSSEVPVPEGHYADESMKVTVVPNRNMIMVSVAAGWAVSLDFDAIALAVHSGDHAIYPDCRPEFIHAMRDVLFIANYKGLALFAPFLYDTKAEIVRMGVDRRAPLALTWSCYKGGRLHCGLCGTCVERREAFKIAGMPDPTEYEITEEMA